MNFFETFPECSLPNTVSKNVIKMIGHHSRLRDVMGQSYLICVCTRTNHARYSSVHVTFCTRARSCARSCARADDAKIVRSRNAQCKTRESHWGDSSEIKVTDEFFWNFPWMFSTKHCFEKCNKNDRSPFSFKKCDGPILPHLCLYSRLSRTLFIGPRYIFR